MSERVAVCRQRRMTAKLWRN